MPSVGSKRIIAVLLAVTLLGSSGCAKRYIYGFKGDEYINLKAGETFTAPHDSVLLSKEFFKEAVDMDGIVESAALEESDGE